MLLLDNGFEKERSGTENKPKQRQTPPTHNQTPHHSLTNRGEKVKQAQGQSTIPFEVPFRFVLILYSNFFTLKSVAFGSSCIGSSRLEPTPTLG